MVTSNNSNRLSKSELLRVEKALFEITRKQKNQDSPAELPVIGGITFWNSIGQLLTNMESELSETIMEEGMSGKAQLLSRRLGTARTCIEDLTRMRLNAFTRHAITSGLLLERSKGSTNNNGFQRIEWERHDPSERIFYGGISELTEKYKIAVFWKSLLGSSEEVSTFSDSQLVHKPLTQFTPDSDDKQVFEKIPTNTEREWREPDIDEEDRIRELEAFPEHASSQAESKSSEEKIKDDSDDLIRIRIIKDISDPIISSDGTEMALNQGDIEFCQSLIAETLIAAGLAEPATI